MQSLSMDLRERIVSAYEANEGSYRTLAKRFSVSRSTVGKLVRQARRLGTLEPQVHLRGRKRTIAGETEVQLQRHLDEHPDATLEARIRDLGLNCCVNTMWESVRRLGHSFKKSPLEPRNKIVKMLPNSD
jgi:transposase